MKKIKILMIFLQAFAFNVKSQNIYDVLENNNLNYFQKIEQIENIKSNASKGIVTIDSSMLKRYNRYVVFWNNRIDQNGSTVHYTEMMKNFSNTSINYSININWKNIGPRLVKDHISSFPVIGRLESISVAIKGNDTIIYAGSNSGGLFKSIDGGKTYTCKTENILGGVKRIIIHPINKDTMFIATGVNLNGLIYSGFYGTGCYRSFDGGETWQSILPFEPSEMVNFRDIKFDPVNPNIVYALTIHRIYKSTDLGNTWISFSEELSNGDSKLNEIDILPNDTSKIMLSGCGLFRKLSNNGWENITTSLYQFIPASIQGNMALRIGVSSYNNDFYILLFFKDNVTQNDYNKFLRTSDYGNTFELLYSQNISAKGFVLDFEISPNGTFYGGGVMLFKSFFNYNSFLPKGTALHSDIRDICIPEASNPNLIYVATDGGVGKSIDGAEHWQNISGDLSVNECYTVSISNIETDLFLTGTHDNGTHKRNADGTWKNVYGGDGGATAINPLCPDTLFHRGNYNLTGSFNGGSNSFNTKISTPLSDYDSPILPNPINPLIIYAAGQANGSGTIVRSTDGGRTFLNDKQGETPETPIDSAWSWDWGYISAIAMSKHNTNVLYFSAYDVWMHHYLTIRRKADTIVGGTGEDVSFNLKNELINSDTKLYGLISSIEVSPTNENLVWVTVGNFSDGKKVYQLDYQNHVWQNISYNLDNIPVNSITFYEPEDMLYIGTDVGVYYLTNISSGTDQTWERYGDFPLCIASDLKINNSTGELVVATYGRGVWTADIGCYFNNNTYTLSGNETWSTNKKINQTVVIPSGVTLTITSGTKIRFSPDSKIEIHPRGKLIIDGATLTNSCGGLWKGIFLLGNKYTYQSQTTQPKIILINGATIENSSCGVFCGNETDPGMYGGGIVYANGASFINCKSGISMQQYHNFQPQNPSLEINNMGYINNCRFETNENYKNLGDHPYAGIALWGVNGVSIRGNTFINTAPEVFDYNKRGYGVVLSDAGCTISPLTLLYPQFGTIASTFTNLYKGVFITHGLSTNNLTISSNTFSNNFYAIEDNAYDNINVLQNVINMNSQSDCGIILYGCNNFRVEENTIIGNSSNTTAGIYAYHTSTTASQIYKNNISNLTYGILATQSPNLHLNCNIFNENKYQIYSDDNGLNHFQGSRLLASGNQFYPNCSSSQNEIFAYYLPSNLIYYYYDAKANDQQPLCHTNNVSLMSISSENTCPSNININNGQPQNEDLVYAINSTITQEKNTIGNFNRRWQH